MSTPDEPLDMTGRATRIRDAQLATLYRGAFAIPTNIIVGLLTAFLLSDVVPVTALASWWLVTIALAAARLMLDVRFRAAQRRGDPLSGKWAIAHTAGAFASGAVWGALAFLLPAYGDLSDYVLIAMVTAGMTAGALTTLVSYYPAFVAYTVPFALPVAVVALVHGDRDIAGAGALIAFYLVMILIAGRKLNADVLHTITLRIDNEALRASLLQARDERDTAREEKWSSLAQLSHVLRTPLNAILGFSDTMRARLFGPLGNPHYDAYAEHIHASGCELLRLTEELLELSGSEGGELRLSESEVDLHDLGEACIADRREEAETARVLLVNAVSSRSPHLCGDEAKLRHLLLNLIDNSIRFTPPGGQVTLSAPVTSQGLHLKIEDTGIGMTAEEIQIARQPFGRIATPLTRSHDGIGLGLTIAIRFAELHGATFAIESAPGAGTVCTITFPARRLRRMHGSSSRRQKQADAA